MNWAAPDAAAAPESTRAATADRAAIGRTSSRTGGEPQRGAIAPSMPLLTGGAETYTAHATAGAAAQFNRVYLTRQAWAASIPSCRVR
ncbi:MAG: hypothetical protein MUC86_14885 [Burkholderiaceae bacterium]|jgi:hypothetical protein|nr:hypothetical protein [Burkholderiaceae bacterium]